jgi:hypothetical protein
MAAIGLSEAARLTGKPRSTIHRAMKDGRLSFAIGPGGARLIDPAELERVYTIKSQRNGATDAPAVPSNTLQQPFLVAQLEAERAKAAGLEALVAAHESTIGDLRGRLDRSEEERRQAQALLTDQRPQHRPQQRQPWWRWPRRANESAP